MLTTTPIADSTTWRVWAGEWAAVNGDLRLWCDQRSAAAVRNATRVGAAPDHACAAQRPLFPCMPALCCMPARACLPQASLHPATAPCMPLHGLPLTISMPLILSSVTYALRCRARRILRRTATRGHASGGRGRTPPNPGSQTCCMRSFLGLPRVAAAVAPLHRPPSGCLYRSPSLRALLSIIHPKFAIQTPAKLAPSHDSNALEGEDGEAARVCEGGGEGRRARRRGGWRRPVGCTEYGGGMGGLLLPTIKPPKARV